MLVFARPVCGESGSLTRESGTAEDGVEEWRRGCRGGAGTINK